MKIRFGGLTISNETESPRPTAQRFGLVEAERAMAWITSADQAKAVFGVVVGVLGFEDKVAADIEQVKSDLAVDRARSEGQIASRRESIARMSTEIGELQGSVEATNARSTQLDGVGAIFSDSPS